MTSPFYVVAFTDRSLRFRLGGRHYTSFRIGNFHALGERRRSRPAAVESELRHQHRVVVRARNLCEGVLPARFGSLVDRPSLQSLVRGREHHIEDALARVRGRLQMTVRVVRDEPPAPRPPASSGREYLAQKREAASPPVSNDVARLLKSLSRYVALEQRAPGAGSLLVTIHHLVEDDDVAEYLETASRRPCRGVIVSGPSPAFAFVPSLI